MKKRFSFKKIFYDNRILFFIALIVSILLWFIVVTQVNSSYQRTIWNVPITVSDTDPTLSNHHLHAYDKSSQTVSIQVTGPRDQIGRLSAQDFYVSPTMTSVNTPGTYTLYLNKSLVTSNPAITIDKVKPETVDIKFDTMTTVPMDVVPKIINGGAAEGYDVQSPVAAPAQVNVTGPTGIVSKIKQASVKVDIGANATDVVNSKGDILLLDAAGDPVESPYLKLSSKTSNITVQVFKKKEIPLKVSFINIPSGYDESNVTVALNPATITVEGPADQVDKLSSIPVSQVDFTTLNTTNQMTFNITLPSGLINVNSIKTVDADISLKNLAAASLNVTSFNYLNLPAHHSADVLTPISNVKIFGPPVELSALTGLAATIDLSGITKSGTFTLPALVSSPGPGFVLQQSQYTVTVRIRYAY